MTDSKNSSTDQAQATERKNVDDDIKFFNNIIAGVNKDEPDKLKWCLKKRAKALFQSRKFDLVLKDCQQLRDLQYDMAKDSELTLIEAQSKYRMVTAETLATFKHISITYNLDHVREWANGIDSIDLDTILYQVGTLSRQNSIKRRK